MADNGAEGELLLSTFRMGDTLLGIDAGCVQEITKLKPITRVHHASASILGVINLRGKIVTVVDLKQRLGLGEQRVGELSRIIIVAWKTEVSGLLVEAVGDVAPVETASIQKIQKSAYGKVSGSYLHGIARKESALVGILNLDALFGE
jgi:purine-binding chemotaxis protein CheW